MTEHQHPEEIKQSVVVESPSGGIWAVPVSIIIAALVIAGSVLYNGKMTVESIDSGLSRLAALNTGAGQGQQAGQQAQAPTAPVAVKDRAGEPVMGKSGAKVTMYEFSDFQCPFCKKFFEESYKQIKAKYVDTGKVKIIYRHFPLPFHQNAEIAAVAGECANLQGKFEQYHDLLFTNGQSDGKGLEIADLKKYADSLGLNSGTLGLAKNKFNQCLDSKSTLDIVKKDMADGTSYGVSGTPTFFINGKTIVGAQPLAAFEQVIDEALK